MFPYNQKAIILLSDSSQVIHAVEEYLQSINSNKELIILRAISDLRDNIVASDGRIVMIDHSLGRAKVEEGLSILKEVDKDAPLIIITEKDKQDEAGDLLEIGVEDYITTDNMNRLGPVIRREQRAYEEILAGKRARQEIKELMNIIDSAEDEVYVLGGDSYKIKFANKKALTNLGYSINELYGMGIEEVAEELLPLRSDRDKHKQSRVMFQTRFIRKDGTKYPAEAVFQTAETEGSVSILAIVHDTTEKESVKQHAFVLNKAIDASASSVTVIDSKSKIVYVNKKQIEIAGKSKAFLVGNDLTEERMYENSGKEFLDAIEACKKGESWIGEYQKTGYNGEEYIMLGSISPVTGEGGKVANIIIVEEDITESVHIKTQLLHAQKMETVGELTSGIAHDFTNMLTAIGGFSSIMKRKMEKDSRFYTYAEKISELTVRAKGLTKNLLTFSRKQMEAERPVSVNSLVKSVGEFLTMVIGSRIELVLDLMDDDVNIMGDPVQLEQVIINLATNARDAIEAEGVLTIKTDRSMVSDASSVGGFREFATISVKDNGCGMDKKTLDKVFEPFYTTKDAGKGTGLGLYIVTDIVSRHKGDIDCISVPDEGTEFVIRIPSTEKAVEENGNDNDVEDSLQNITILLAEDEKIVRESLAHALDVYGYNIIEAVNGKEAVDIYNEREGKIDLVLTDIVMPVMNGITAYNEIISTYPDQKFIFTTGYVGEAHRRDGFNGEDHVLMIKPLMIKDLVKKIESMLAQ